MNNRITMFVGADTYDMYEALLMGNDKRVAELGAIHRAKFDKQVQDEKDRVLKTYGQETLDVFNQLDVLFRRDHSYLYGGYKWNGKTYRIERDGDEYSESEYLEFKDGLFKMYVWYCDSTGYDQGSRNVFSGVPVNEILSKL